MTKVSAERQTGSAVLLAATSIILLGTGLVMAQLNATKADTASAAYSETSITGPAQAAALAVAAGIAFVNGLSSNTLCSGSTGCNAGVYGASALSGGASNQPASWWTASNAQNGPVYTGLRLRPLYVVEYLSCDSNGNATYRVTGRAASNAISTTSSVANESGGAFVSRTVIKAWGVAPTTTGVFINQLSSSYNAGLFGPNLAYNATNTLDANSTGSTIGFTSGRTGYITMLDMHFALFGSPVNSDCSTHLFTIGLSNLSTGFSASYSTTLNNWTRDSTSCYQGTYNPWDSNTSYGLPLTPAFAVTSGDSVTVTVSYVNYSGQVLNLTAGPGSDVIKVKLIGTKTGLPNCPA